MIDVGVRAPFSEWLALCGLSHAEAAAFHAVSVDSIRSWSSRRRPVPERAMKELANLWALILLSDRTTDLRGCALPAGAIERRRAIREALDFADPATLIDRHKPTLS